MKLLTHRRFGSRRGFTLVEIMIVVAIIALLAAIAIPGFLRSRKRSQATVILNDARILDAAIDQYAIEAVHANTTSVSSVAAGLLPYLKDGTRLYGEIKLRPAAPNDVLGNPYVYTTFNKTLKVNTSTTSSFSDVVENGSSFWGTYY